MKYVVEIAGERLVVEIDGTDVRIGDRLVSARLNGAEASPVRHLDVDGVGRRVVMRREGGRGVYSIWIDGHRVVAQALDERMRALHDLTAASAQKGPAPLIAPMPGLIVKIHVAVGEMVSAGQGLVAMEAMKMENELRAPSDGRVRAVLVAPGGVVEKGAILVELE